MKTKKTPNKVRLYNKSLTADTARKIRAGAERAGVSVAQFMADILERGAPERLKQLEAEKSRRPPARVR